MASRQSKPPAAKPPTPTPSSRAAVLREFQSSAPDCFMMRFAEQASPEELRELKACLADATLPVAAIHRAVIARGLQVSKSTLLNHRHGICGRCYGRSTR